MENKNEQFENAIETTEQPQKNPITEQMDGIIKKADKFETIRVIMELLCKELEIGPDSSPKAIFDRIGEVTTDYYKAMDLFKDLRNGNQGRDGKIIDLKAKKGKN